MMRMNGCLTELVLRIHVIFSFLVQELSNDFQLPLFGSLVKFTRAAVAAGVIWIIAIGIAVVAVCIGAEQSREILGRGGFRNLGRVRSHVVGA